MYRFVQIKFYKGSELYFFPNYHVAPFELSCTTQTQTRAYGAKVAIRSRKKYNFSV